MQTVFHAVKISSINLSFYLSIITLETFLYPLILFLSTPILVMCIAYGVIWWKKTAMLGNRNRVVRETRLAKTLLIITAASLYLAAISILEPVRKLRCTWRSPWHINMTIYIIKFLQFSNSLSLTFPPFVYKALKRQPWPDFRFK